MERRNCVDNEGNFYHFGETSWVPQYCTVVSSSKVFKIDVFQSPKELGDPLGVDIRSGDRYCAFLVPKPSGGFMLENHGEFITDDGFDLAGIRLHRALLKARLGLDAESKISEKERMILGSLGDSEALAVAMWVNGSFGKEVGINRSLIKEILGQLSAFDSEKCDWIMKHSMDGMREAMQLLYDSESSKDFTLVVEGDGIPCHKFILAAASELFFGMFTSVQDGCELVSDMSEKSYDSVNSLVRFLYLGNLEFSADEDADVIKRELGELIEFYLLRPKIKSKLTSEIARH